MAHPVIIRIIVAIAKSNDFGHPSLHGICYKVAGYVEAFSHILRAAPAPSCSRDVSFDTVSLESTTRSTRPLDHFGLVHYLHGILSSFTVDILRRGK